MAKSIGIIGAGVSGLSSAKEALQKGFNITLFEKMKILVVFGIQNQVKSGHQCIQM